MFKLQIVITDEIDPSTYSFTNALKGKFLKNNQNVNINLKNIENKRGMFKYVFCFFFWFAALQAKTMFNNREWLTQEGFALNSKWNEAEKYICNPVSGEVPMECLSSKTLSARSFRNLTTTMSAPLHYPNPNPLMNNIGQNKPNDNPNVKVIHEDLYAPDPVLVRGD